MSNIQNEGELGGSADILFRFISLRMHTALHHQRAAQVLKVHNQNYTTA